LGGIAVYQEEYDRAQTLHRRSVDLARKSGDRWLLGITLLNLADCAAHDHDFDAATALLREALETGQRIGGGILSTACLEAFAAVQLGRGRPEHTIRLLAAAATYRADTAQPLNSQERQRVDQLLAHARAAVGPIRFALFWAAGADLAVTQAADELLDLSRRR
jgi:hypothetical protein